MLEPQNHYQQTVAFLWCVLCKKNIHIYIYNIIDFRSRFTVPGVYQRWWLLEFPAWMDRQKPWGAVKRPQRRKARRRWRWTTCLAAWRLRWSSVTSLFLYIHIYMLSAPARTYHIYIYVYIYILYLRYPRSFPFFPNIKENPGAVSTRGSRNPGIPNHKSWDSSPQNYLEVLALCTGTSSYLHHTLKQLQSFIIQSWFNLWSHFRSCFSKLRRKKPRGKGDEGSKIPKKKHQAYATLKRRFLPLECHIQTFGRKKWIDANLISVRSKEPSKQIWVS